VKPTPAHHNPHAYPVLAVDDVPLNLKILGGLLSLEGIAFRSAAGGQEALDAAKENPPDLILLDVNMPGMDGYEVCRSLKNMPETNLNDFYVLGEQALRAEPPGPPQICRFHEFCNCLRRLSGKTRAG
jgi:CheY-like chemotaxis protein